MKKRTLTLITMLLFSFVAQFVGMALASTTLGTIGWHITNVARIDNQPVQMNRDYLWLDVDLGNSFFHVYGAFMDHTGNDIQAATGSGYTMVDEDGSSRIKIEVRGGTYLYRLDLDMNSLGGAIAIYDKDGEIFAVGSVELESIQ